MALPCWHSHAFPQVDDYLPPELLRSPLEDAGLLPVSAFCQSQFWGTQRVPLHFERRNVWLCCEKHWQLMLWWSIFLSWTQPPYWNARFKCFIRTLKGVEQGSKNIRTYTHTTWYHFQSVDLLFVAFCLSAMSLVRHERGCIPCFNCSSAGAQGLTAWSWGTSPGSQSILNGLTFQAPEEDKDPCPILFICFI